MQQLLKLEIYTDGYIKEVEMRRSVLEFLEESTDKFGDKVAFGDQNNTITYKDLKRVAKTIATNVTDVIGEVYRKPVVVFIDRNIESLISFMGVVYSGNFYVPVDKLMPAARIQLIFETLNPVGVIMTGDEDAILDEVKFEGPRFKYEEIINGSINEEKLSNIRKQMLSTDPLYAIFTSGSTGVPKGVLVGNGSVIDLVDCFTEEFDFDDTRVFGNQAPFDFDVSVKDIYSTLRNGATLYIVPKVLFVAPAKLITYLDEHKINTIIWAASALRIMENLKAFKKQLPSYLRTVMFSGEIMSNKVLNYWRTNLPEVSYVNLYGPTEITCNCTFYKVDRPYADDETLPIGVNFINTKILLLNDEDKEAKVGETGEICVVGASLALGYYNNPEKTSEAFCQNPLNTAYPEKIYRTGDLGYYNEEGLLMFVSRKDYQVKHMGHRIELGEIEVVANALSYIDAAVMVYDDKKEKIVMFYQSKNECDKQILTDMGDKLPKYMFPNRLVHFEKLPVNKNGKIDRVLLKKDYIENV